MKHNIQKLQFESKLYKKIYTFFFVVKISFKIGGRKWIRKGECGWK